MTATVATVGGGVVTVRLCEPVLPSLVAVIEADPLATAVTSPALDTVATDVLELDHVIVAPGIVAQLASRATARACVV